LQPTELWPQEQQLCAKAAEGGLLDLRCRRPAEDDPIRGGEWDRGRWVRAQVLFQLVTGHGPQLSHSAVAVRLRGAQVVGRLNLGGWKLRCPLELSGCHLRHQLDLAKAEAPNITLRGSYLRSRLSARRLRTVHTLNLASGFHCDRGAILKEAHIGGHLNCTEAVFSNPNGQALNAARMTVDTDMILHKAHCTGEVSLFGTHIGDYLNCAKAIFTNLNGPALNAIKLTVDTSMILHKAHCTGEVSLLSAHIGGQLNCTKATFSNPNGQALDADQLTVNNNLVLTKAHCTGEVSLFGTHIGGHLSCTEAVFSNPNGQALNANGLTVDIDMILHKAHCTGKVSLFGTHIGDYLNCTEATFSNPNGQALNANGLTVDTSMILHKAHCTGKVSLLSAHIGDHLDCTEAIFINLNGQALNANGLTVDTSMILHKAHCTGEVWLFDTHIGDHLDCTEAIFINNSEDLAVNLGGASVGQSVTMRPKILAGGLNLHRAQVGVWCDEKRTWPTRLELEGFVYGSIDAPDATVKDRLESWLPRNSYLPQPYEQLAGVYQREGNEQDARTVAIGNQRARRAASAQRWVPSAEDRRWSSRYLMYLWSVMLRAWSAVLRWTIGYGYRPALALVPLTLLILVGSVLFQLVSHHPHLLHPAKTGAEQPSFNALRYTVDLLLPVANFKQRDSFVTGGWAAWASFGFIFAGWLLAAIVVTGLAGVFKRD
jgi:hypothetical protein